MSEGWKNCRSTVRSQPGSVGLCLWNGHPTRSLGSSVSGGGWFQEFARDWVQLRQSALGRLSLLDLIGWLKAAVNRGFSGLKGGLCHALVVRIPNPIRLSGAEASGVFSEACTLGTLLELTQ